MIVHVHDLIIPEIFNQLKYQQSLSFMILNTNRTKKFFDSDQVNKCLGHMLLLNGNSVIYYLVFLLLIANV